MQPQVDLPKHMGCGKAKITLFIVFALLILFLVILLATRGVQSLINRTGATVAGAAVTAQAAIYALNEKNYHLLQSLLSPRIRNKLNDFVAEWDDATRDLGSVRSFGQFTGSMYMMNNHLVSQGSCFVELENGSLSVRFVLIYSKGKWIIDSMKVENYQSRNRLVVVRYPPPEINIPYSLDRLQVRVRHNPNDITAHFYLMCLYAQKRQWEQALHHALQARRLDNTNVNAHLGAIYAYANLGRWQEAYDSVQAALKLSFDNQARSALLRVKGDLLMDRYALTHQKRLLQQALSTYQQALKIDPANTQAIVGIALVEIERQAYRTAKQRLQKALSQVQVQEPGGRRRKALVLYYLGVIEERQGRLKEAEQLYQEAVQTHPQSFLLVAKE